VKTFVIAAMLNGVIVAFGSPWARSA